MKCAGRPYTTDLDQMTCPTCGAYLQIERVDDHALEGREKLTVETPPEESFHDIPEENGFYPDQTDNTELKEYGHSSPEQFRPMVHAPKGVKSSAGGGAAVRGKVFQYSSTGKEDGSYRRFPWTKLIDAIVYKQRFEDVLHRFYVRVEGEKDAFGNVTYRDVPVNVHGTIAGGMQITDNCIAEVEGKFRGGVLMAERVCLVNDGFRSQVKFQHSPTAILYGIFAIAALIFLIAIGFSSDGAFFDNIGTFLKSWLITAVIVTVLYFVLLFTRAGLVTQLLFGRKKGGGFPLLGIALISLLLTLIFMNSFGIGSAVGGVFSNIFGPIISFVVLIIVIIVVLKLFL